MIADSVILTTKFSVLLPSGAMANLRYRFSEVLKRPLNVSSCFYFSFCLPNAFCVLSVILPGGLPSQLHTLSLRLGSPARLYCPETVQGDKTGGLVARSTFIKKSLRPGLTWRFFKFSVTENQAGILCLCVLCPKYFESRNSYEKIIVFLKLTLWKTEGNTKGIPRKSGI